MGEIAFFSGADGFQVGVLGRNPLPKGPVHVAFVRRVAERPLRNLGEVHLCGPIGEDWELKPTIGCVADARLQLAV